MSREPVAAASSQVIGSFPGVSGGFEDEPVASMLPVLSVVSGPSSTWTIQSSAGPAVIHETGGRSGPRFLTFGNSAYVARRLQSPTAPAGAIVPGEHYVMQFYYRSSGTNVFPTGLFQIGISAGGSGGNIPYVELSLRGSGGAWRKVAEAFTAYPGSGANGLGIIRSTTGAIAETDIDIDDFTIYPCDELPVADLIPPGAALEFSVGDLTQNSVHLSWSSPAGGVDGGGYLLTRGGTGVQADPNTNGIYAVGNDLGPGRTVVYIGTNTSFLDASLNPGATYSYRLYTVDKAFNYSGAAALTATTVAEPLVTVVKGPRIETSGGTNWFLVYLGGSPGKSYVIEAASSVKGPWATLRTVDAPTNDPSGFGPGVFELREAVSVGTTEFYRATRSAD